jgi:hypothetical protein
MKKKYAGMQYWLLYTAVWIGIIILLKLDENEDYSLFLLVLIALVAGYATALMAYNLEDYIKYAFRKLFSRKSKIGLSARIKKPKFRFRMIPDRTPGR